MPKLFIKAVVNNSTVYIKVESTVIEPLFDVLHDNGYKITKVLPQVWDYYIEYGKSYEVDTIEEVMEFKELNIKAKAIKHESQSQRNN